MRSLANDLSHMLGSISVMTIRAMPTRSISIWDNYSWDLLSSGIFRSRDLTAYLVVLHEALAQFGAPEMLVSDSGGIFLAKQAHHIYATLGIQKKQIDKHQAWKNYAETLFTINRQLADYAYATAQSWEELCRVHAKYIHDYRHQEHWAHREREDGKQRTPKDVLGWMQGRPCTPAQLDDAFTLRFLRCLDRYGNMRPRKLEQLPRRRWRRAVAGVPLWDTTKLTTMHSRDEVQEPHTHLQALLRSEEAPQQ